MSELMLELFEQSMEATLKTSGKASIFQSLVLEMNAQWSLQSIMVLK